MDAEDGAIPVTAPSTIARAETSSYGLHRLISQVPVTGEDGEKGYITCVDAWEDNLYIGTSLGDVLHYVALPADPADESGEPSYIFATKLRPPFNAPQEGRDAGVRRILVLPEVGKACIVCNATLTFYTLPELSPAFGGKIKQTGCLWVGGMNQNLQEQTKSTAAGTIIIICLRQNLRLIRVSDAASKIRDIELGAVTALQRRGDLACVADAQSYSLLDVVNQRKNELFPISSLTVFNQPTPQLELPQSRVDRRDSPSSSPARHAKGHERSISNISSLSTGSSDPGSSWPKRNSSRRAKSPAAQDTAEPSLAAHGTAPQSSRQSAEVQREEVAQVTPLPPNIVTPTPDEFLLTTGTRLSEPGVGMFVDKEGDVVREPIEFSTYPESLILDRSEQTPSEVSAENHVLALVRFKTESRTYQAIEIRGWRADRSEAHKTRERLVMYDVPLDGLSEDALSITGMSTATTGSELTLDGIGARLRLRRAHIKTSNSAEDSNEAKRNAEEDKFASRISQIRANVLLYHEDWISWVARNPLLIRLDDEMERLTQTTDDVITSIQVGGIQKVVESIAHADGRDELEFLTLNYVRQKASLLLLGDLVAQATKGIIAPERERRNTESALATGEIDPRLVLVLIAPLREEIVEGVDGIWIAQGLRDTVSSIRRSIDDERFLEDSHGAYRENLLLPVKRFLMVWRSKKGFGSVADETHVFQSVDAALLRLLLMLDQDSPRGPAMPGSIRAELNEVIGKGVDCFDRAVALFERFNRLYLLSRLYQSRVQQDRTMVAKVLATWKRVLEGEYDAGGELIEGESDVRRYLAKIRNHSLVQEYGCWLARRNPKLGVQVFADERSNVRFEPAEAVNILQQSAPMAVKDYLEHLVFAKKHTQYIDRLITYYLDTVLGQLNESADSKRMLVESYESYRALKPPKPTYRDFITDNGIDADWWQNRLRLLQLIGGSRGATKEYDSSRLREQLAPYSQELVPEMIILNNREGNHEEALRLLTHGLGDYDTAIRYCLLGGASIFDPASGLLPSQSIPSHEQQVELFGHLLHQFFQITDPDDRLERTAELLEKFAGFYDIREVLDLIPETWSVEAASGFLIHALRLLIRERHETGLVQALSSAQNLRRAVELIDKMEETGPTILHTEVEAE